MGGIAWTEEEDYLLKKCIENFGEGNWHRIPHLAGLNRCRKSCRLRWLNYLRPNIKRGNFTQDEVDLIVNLHNLFGNRWSLIAGKLPGRTANDVKNYWNCHLIKKLKSIQGIENNNNKSNSKKQEYSRSSSSSSLSSPLSNYTEIIPISPTVKQGSTIDFSRVPPLSPNLNPMSQEDHIIGKFKGIEDQEIIMVHEELNNNLPIEEESNMGSLGNLQMDHHFQFDDDHDDHQGFNLMDDEYGYNNRQFWDDYWISDMDLWIDSLKNE